MYYPAHKVNHVITAECRVCLVLQNNAYAVHAYTILQH